MRKRLPALLLSSCGLVLVGLAIYSRLVPVAVPDEGGGEEGAARRVARAQAGDEKDGPTKPGHDGGTFRFPADKGGALLAKELAPEGDTPPAPRRGPRRREAVPPRLQPPALPLPPSSVPVPRLLPPRKAQTLQPRFVTEETLDGLPGDPVPPQAASLPVGNRVRVVSADANEPPPLPILAQPVPDRVSLEDATGEASTAAVLAAEMPRRTTPAPFLRLTLPDPFENRRPLYVQAPAEKTAPATGSPRTPKP